MYQADKKINYYQPTIVGEKNPYNPFSFETEFNINVVDDAKYDEIK
jgi:hypothetical protein